jgi:outer membrane biosynthesis protein TonB
MKHRIPLVGGLLIALGAFTANAAESSNAQPVVDLRIVKYVAPQFPGFAKLQGISDGYVVVAFSHDMEGRVTDALALWSTDDAFTREAIEAVQQWRVALHGAEGRPCQCAHVIRLAFHAGGIVRLAATHLQARGSSDLASGYAEHAVSVPTFEELDLKPKALAQLVPPWPKALPGNTDHSGVSVTFFVDQAGRARVPSIVSATDPALGAAVAQAILQWRYEPPHKNGKAVAAVESLNLDINRAVEPPSFAATHVVAGDGVR